MGIVVVIGPTVWKGQRESKWIRVKRQRKTVLNNSWAKMHLFLSLKNKTLAGVIHEELLSCHSFKLS